MTCVVVSYSLVIALAVAGTFAIATLISWSRERELLRAFDSHVQEIDSLDRQNSALRKALYAEQIKAK